MEYIICIRPIGTLCSTRINTCFVSKLSYYTDIMLIFIHCKHSCHLHCSLNSFNFISLFVFCSFHIFHKFLSLTVCFKPFDFKFMAIVIQSEHPILFAACNISTFHIIVFLGNLESIV